MKGFHSTFNSFGKGGFAPKDWEQYFLSYDESEWLPEGDGILQFFSDENKRFSLTIIHVPNRGFVLQFDCRSLDEQRSLFCNYVVADRKVMSHFEEVDDGLAYPTGCIVLPSTAWVAVKDFLKNPTLPSSNLDWIADEEISWPEQ
mgnify:FL=1